MSSTSSSSPTCDEEEQRDGRRAALAGAEALALRDQSRGLAALDALFRAGRLPVPPPVGFCAGHFAAFALPPGLARPADWLASAYAPWRGKVFDPARGRGANVVSRRFLPLSRLIWPFYRGYDPAGRGAYRAFPFHTYPGAALLDPGLQVLKLDYDLPENPRFIVRSVLDEIVQIDEGLYLGRWHFRWPGEKWQFVAYFVLERSV